MKQAFWFNRTKSVPQLAASKFSWQADFVVLLLNLIGKTWQVAWLCRMRDMEEASPELLGSHLDSLYTGLL